MINAKDILVKLKGDNKNFKGAMTGANTSMKGFATTTTASTTVAATSTKAMALSMASSMALATAGITIVIGGVVALAGALKAAVKGASDDADVTAQTTALLKQQGIAWYDVSDAVTNHIETLQNMTGFADTELQESFNEFISAGMNVEEALQAMDAATAIAASGQMTLTASSMVLRKEFTVGTSRLKNWGIEADNMSGILEQVNDKFGDGSQRAETFEGKMGILTEAIMDQLKPLGAQLLPIMTDVLDLFIWGARNVLPLLIRGFQLLMIPIKGVIMNLKQIYEVAKAAWSALTGDWEAAETHWNNVWKLQKEFNKESMNTILNIESEAGAQDRVTIAVQGTADAHNANADAINDENAALQTQLSLQERIKAATSRQMAAVRKGVTAREYSEGQYGNWTQIKQAESAAAEGRPPTAPPSASKSGAP